MYIMHNKTFQHKCDAFEESYQLCREYSRSTPHWHVMKYNEHSMLHGYYVWDTMNKEIVLDMTVMEMGD